MSTTHHSACHFAGLAVSAPLSNRSRKLCARRDAQGTHPVFVLPLGTVPASCLCKHLSGALPWHANPVRHSGLGRLMHLRARHTAFQGINTERQQTRYGKSAYSHAVAATVSASLSQRRSPLCVCRQFLALQSGMRLRGTCRICDFDSMRGA